MRQFLVCGRVRRVRRVQFAEVAQEPVPSGIGAQDFVMRGGVPRARCGGVFIHVVVEAFGAPCNPVDDRAAVGKSTCDCGNNDVEIFCITFCLASICGSVPFGFLLTV